MHTLIFATHNPGKTREIQQILDGRYQLKTLTDIGCLEEIPETEPTLEGNARLKARYVYDRYGLDCFAEDTGLEVTALDSAPGVHTARYAGESKDPQANIAKLLENLAGVPDRSARFRTVIILIINDQETMFEGICNGYIADEPRGTGGFGYDPVFIPNGYDHTFAELPDDVKNSISHRAKATEWMVRTLNAR